MMSRLSFTATVFSILPCLGVLAARLHADDVLYHGTLVPLLPGHSESVPGDINDAAQVVGASLSLSGASAEAFLWDTISGTIEPLGTGFYSTTGAVNDLTQVAGLLNSQAFLWTPEDGTLILGDLPGGTLSSSAFGINNRTQVVGISVSENGQEAFLWTAEKGMVGLGDLPGGQFLSKATGVNDDSWIAGESVSFNGMEAFLWTADAGMVGLGDLPGGGFLSSASAINNLGQVVGSSSSSLGRQAFLWDPEEGMMGLGIIPGPRPGSATLAQDINDQTQVVGWALVEIPRDHRGFIWDRRHGLRDLNQLLDAASAHFHVGFARAINNHGQIVTEGRGDRLLLTPFVLADMNCDELVDASDIHPFLMALNDPDLYAQKYPDCHADWAGDVNQDGVFDAADLVPFIRRFLRAASD